MFALFSLSLSADKSDYFFWNARDDGIFFNGKNMFSDHWYVRPGLKAGDVKVDGGEKDFFNIVTKNQNEALAWLYIYTGEDDYVKLEKKIKFSNTFRTQLTTVSTQEVYSGNTYLGREFTQDTVFISYKKIGENYSLSAMPFSSKLRAETFLWNRAAWSYITEEKDFDLSRANDKKYVDYVYNYVSDMKKVVKAPYRILVTGDIINQIFRKLNVGIDTQKKIFLERINQMNA